MKKVVLVGAMLLLAGCGTNDEVKEQNEALQQQQQLEEQKTPQEEVVAVEMQTLASDGNIYTKTTVNVQPEGDENIYEAMLRTVFPIYTFNYVKEEGDTITIDVHENSTGSPNMTASAQVSEFLDILEYTLTTNFPELKGYYLSSNDEVTYLGDFGPFETLQYLEDFSLDNLYLPIEE